VRSPPEVERVTPVRVLVIEHNQIFLRLVTRFLQETYSDLVSVVGVWRDDEQALEQSRQFAQQIILLDVDRHNGECPEMIQRLRRWFDDVRIVAMASPTGGSTLYPRQAALAAGADDFISKRDLGTDLLPLLRAESGAR
jgi:CheY-like chemotaxis protein